MCGIAGIINIVNSQKINIDRFESSLLKMKHRGPDSYAVKLINENVILGHLRLSIIDLTDNSNQPFNIGDNLWVVFNGEIYNYIELREELITLGHEFRTKGDTEVLLKSYQQWGEDCVKKFNGMWSFVIYDINLNKIFCSRDRFGVKPFNYSVINNQFIFSSEIKTIINYFPNLKKPNYNVIANFCRTSIGAQIKETWFEDVFRLEPSHNLIIQNGQLKIYKYWEYPKIVINNKSFTDSCELYKKLFIDAVNIRMRSDVPVGFTLSSGIDSTSLVCSLSNSNNIKTYTAAFNSSLFKRSEKRNFKSDVEIDESSIVFKLAKDYRLDSKIINIDYNDYSNKLKNIIYYLESGHGSPAVYPLFQVLDIAKKDIKVVMEGQGADELLGGYISSVSPVYFFELILNFKFIKALQFYKYFSKNYSLKSTLMLFIRNKNFSLFNKIYSVLSNTNSLYIGKLKKFNYIKDYPNEPKRFNNSLNEFLYKAHTGGLVNLLHYGDAISMAHSIESRLPFMDYRLVEFVFTLPSEFKIHKTYGKYIHRKAMKDIVPNYILDNPLKFGFDSPLSNIFSANGENTPEDILLSDKCINRGLFSKKVLLNMFYDQRTGKRDNSRILYRLLSVELWFRQFIDYE